MMMPLGGASPVHGSGNLPQSTVQSSANLTPTNASNKSNNVVTAEEVINFRKVIFKLCFRNLIIL